MTPHLQLGGETNLWVGSNDRCAGTRDSLGKELRVPSSWARARPPREADSQDPVASGRPKRGAERSSLLQNAEVGLPPSPAPTLSIHRQQHSPLVTMATNGQCLSQGQAHLPSPRWGVSLEEGKPSHNSQWPKGKRHAPGQDRAEASFRGPWPEVLQGQQVLPSPRH